MFPSVPAADREQLSRVRASLAQDGLDLAMVGRDRQQLLKLAAAIALELGEQAGWRVEKYDPSGFEHLLADLMLARFDTALQRLAGSHSTLEPRLTTGVVLFIPQAELMTPQQLAQLLRLLRGTGHPQLRLVALFACSAGACERHIAVLGKRAARWYLDDEPEHLPGFETSTHAAVVPPARSSLQRRAARPHLRTPARAGIALAVGISVALLLGPTLWPSSEQIARLLTPAPSVQPPSISVLAGERAPFFDTGTAARAPSANSAAPETGAPER